MVNIGGQNKHILFSFSLESREQAEAVECRGTDAGLGSSDWLSGASAMDRGGLGLLAPSQWSWQRSWGQKSERPGRELSTRHRRQSDQELDFPGGRKPKSTDCNSATGLIINNKETTRARTLAAQAYCPLHSRLVRYCDLSTVPSFHHHHGAAGRQSTDQTG